MFTLQEEMQCSNFIHLKHVRQDKSLFDYLVGETLHNRSLPTLKAVNQTF